MEKKEFEKTIRKLFVNFSKFQTTEMNDLLWEYLKGFSIEEIEELVDYVIRHEVAFPPVARILQIKKTIDHERKENEKFKEFLKRKIVEIGNKKEV